MADVNEALTRKVADLARLDLTDAEARLFTQQLGDILKYVETLNQAEVAGVEPMTHPLELATPMREDRIEAPPRDAAGKPKVLGPAPDVLYDGYKVPPIL